MTKFEKYALSLIELFKALKYWTLHSQTDSSFEIKKILVMCYCGLGDMIFLFPMIRSLRQAHPQAKIYILTNPSSPTAQISKGNTDINHIIEHRWTLADANEREQINHYLAQENFDAVIVTSANPVRYFLPGLHRIPLRIGHLRIVQMPWSPFNIPELIKNLWYVYIWQEEFFRKIFFNKPVKLEIQTDQSHDIVKCLRLAQQIGGSISQDLFHPIITITQPGQNFADQFFSANNLQQRQILGISLGMSKDMPYKQWGVKKFAQLARLLSQQFNGPILLLGSSEEKPLADEFIAQNSANVISAIGETSIDQMAALLKRCRLFVSNDTGPAKLAMAVLTPTAMIWGPSDRYGGGTWNNLGLIIHNSSPCSPCLLSGMTLQGRGMVNHSSCGHRQCLNDLSVEFAFNKIKKWLDESKIS